MNKREKLLYGWLLIGAALVFLMVAIGGITRLTHSGLSMVDWKLLMGMIPPLSEEAWQASFELYQQFPEYKELNSHFTISDYKSIFWWEYLHRFLGRIIGILFLIPFIIFWIKGWLSDSLKKQLLFLFILGAFQGFLGWYMVKSGLINVPRVSHYRLAAHLSLAFITCMYIWWIALDLRFPKKAIINQLTLRKWCILLLGLVFLQIIFGAFVAGLKAGWVHNTFPLMDGNLMADSIWALDPWWLNFIEGKSGVQFIHRFLGTLVLIGVGLYYYLAMKAPLLKRQISSVRIIMLATIFQFVLGVFTLLYQVPIVLGVLHQVGALILLGSLVYSIHSLRVQSR